MPLIITEADRDTWLFAKYPEEISALMKPYSGELGSHQTYSVAGEKGRKHKL